MTLTDTPAPVVWTAELVDRALFSHFTNAGWNVTFEVGHREDGRRIDALLTRKARRMGLGPVELLAIEVKVSRSDFLQDVRRPEKQAAWRETAHRHAYAAPKGLIAKDEVPDGCGLIELERDQWSPNIVTVHWTKKAPYTPTPTTPPGWLLQNAMARLGWAEAKLKGFSGEHTFDRDGSATVEDLRAQLNAAMRRAEKAEALAARENQHKRLWRGLAGAMSGLPCATCGELVRGSRLNRSGWGGVVWVHVDPAQEETCFPRRVAAEEAKSAEHQSKYGIPRYAPAAGWNPLIHPSDEDEDL